MNTHDMAKELLPWFVNGSLNEYDHSLVASHVTECFTCERDMHDLLVIAASYSARMNEAQLESYQKSATGRFLEILDSSGESCGVKQGGSFRTRQVRKALAGLMTLFGLIGFSVFLTLLPDEDKFEVMSTESVQSTSVLQIVFVPEATEMSIRDALFVQGQTLLSGPTRQGVYRVGFESAEQGRLVLISLRSSPIVKFVEMETP